MRALMILALIGLAACDDKGAGTDISIRGADGNLVGGADGKTGEIKVDVPGFEGSIKLPKIKLDADSVDLNGVKLYPGSTIQGVDIADGKGAGEAGMRLRFESPAAAATVRDWFGERLGKAGFAVTPDGQGLTGKTNEGEPFRLEMRGDGTQRSTGTIVIG